MTKDNYNIIVQDYDELFNLFDFDSNHTLPKVIVSLIESNLDNNLAVIDKLHIEVIELNTVLNISIQRAHFISLLNEQLTLFEKCEKYEECAKIVKILQKINAGSIVESVKQHKHKNPKK